MAHFPVHHIHSGMRGAPQMTKDSGSLIAILRAAFSTGFGAVAAQGVTVTGGKATATLPNGSSFEAGCIVQVSGATPDILNGNQRVMQATATSITWDTTASDGDATGAIAIKVAPIGKNAAGQGWQEPLTGTDEIMVLRSTDPESNGHYLRLDESMQNAVKVGGFETMTDAHTGTGMFPNAQQAPNGGFWYKCYRDSAAHWDIVADSRMMIVALGINVQTSATPKHSRLYAFGDVLPLSPTGDTWSTILACKTNNSHTSASIGTLGQYHHTTSGGIFSPRGISGMGAAVAGACKPYVGTVSRLSGNDNFLGNFPSPVDGRLKYGSTFLNYSDQPHPRADIPGVLHIAQDRAAGLLAPRTLLMGEGAMAGRVLLALGNWDNDADSADMRGITLLDITGPWR